MPISACVLMSEADGREELEAAAVIGCGADFQSAVSQVCNLLSVEAKDASVISRGPADCKSAVQQSATLRYGGGARATRGRGCPSAPAC